MEKTLEFSSMVLPAPSPYLFGHNRHGPKIGWGVPFFLGGGAAGSPSNKVAWAKAYLH